MIFKQVDRYVNDSVRNANTPIDDVSVFLLSFSSFPSKWTFPHSLCAIYERKGFSRFKMLVAYVTAKQIISSRTVDHRCAQTNLEAGKNLLSVPNANFPCWKNGHF